MFIRQRGHKHPNKREALELASERKDVRREKRLGRREGANETGSKTEEEARS